MDWDDRVEVASFRGVEFEVQSIRDAITHRVVEHVFPYRDGANLEETGRDPRPFTIEGAFFGEGYLARLVEFARLCDEGVTGPFVHPLLGTFDCKVMSFEFTHDGARRDNADFTLELREDGTDTELIDFSGVESAAEDLQTEVDAVASYSEDLVVIVPAEDSNWLDAVNTAIFDAAGFIEDVDSIADDLETRFEQFRKTATDAVAEVANMTQRQLDVVTSQTTEIVQGLQRCVLAAKRLRERAERIKSKIVEFPVDIVAPLSTISLRLYGDSSREADLIRINRIRNPFLVRPGAPIRVFSE